MVFGVYGGGLVGVGFGEYECVEGGGVVDDGVDFDYCGV